MVKGSKTELRVISVYYSLFLAYTFPVVIFMVLKNKDQYSLLFFTPLNISLVLYLLILEKRGYIKSVSRFVKDSFSFSYKEDRDTIIVVTILSLVFMLVMALKIDPQLITSNLFLKEILEQWYPTLSEEIIFRAFMLKFLIRDIKLEKKLGLWIPANSSKITDTEVIEVGKKILIVAMLFSFGHPDSFVELLSGNFRSAFRMFFSRLYVGFFFYGLFYVLSNKKIYPCWLLHLTNNVVSNILSK